MESQCTSLVSAGLENIVLFPKQAAYKARLNSYWSASAALRPWCMALPLTAEDVSIIISTLVKGDCPFGVRSGGHGSFALSSGVENGVTIDLGSSSFPNPSSSCRSRYGKEEGGNDEREY